MSDDVERRLVDLLGNPTTSPFGNPIPGLDELEPGVDHVMVDSESMVPLSDAARDEVRHVVVRPIAEPLQDDGDAMTTIRRIGAMPGASVKVHRSAGGVTIGSAGSTPSCQPRSLSTCSSRPPTSASPHADLHRFPVSSAEVDRDPLVVRDWTRGRCRSVTVSAVTWELAGHAWGRRG